MVTFICLLQPMRLRDWGAEKLVRVCNEINGLTYYGSSRGVVASGGSISSTGGTIDSSSATSSEMAIKILFP
jgi:hypothetical protein